MVAFAPPSPNLRALGLYELADSLDEEAQGYWEEAQKDAGKASDWIVLAVMRELCARECRAKAEKLDPAPVIVRIAD